MNFDENEHLNEGTEVGSDDLLSDDNLHLPESANPLVRLHAIRSWLTRRVEETNVELGEATLELQQVMQEEPAQSTRPRRRERQTSPRYAAVERIQQDLSNAQERLNAYEEAQILLEECVIHTTSGERALVEYYLALEDLLLAHRLEQGEPNAAWMRAIADVQSRVERVGIPHEE